MPSYLLEKQHVFPPRGDATLSDNGEVCMPEVTYGDWRKYVSPEKWAVANMTFTLILTGLRGLLWPASAWNLLLGRERQNCCATPSDDPARE